MELPIARLWSLRQSTVPTSICLPFGMHSAPLPSVESCFFPAVWFRATSPLTSGISCTASNGVGDGFRLAAVDVASGASDVINWLVFLEQDPQFVGRVKEIVEIGRLGDNYHDDRDGPHNYLLKVREARGHRGPEWADKSSKPLELFVPLVDEFVRSIDVKRKRLIISPPDGLLELARRPETLTKLRPILLEFCSQQLQGLTACLQKRWPNTFRDSQFCSQQLQGLTACLQKRWPNTVRDSQTFQQQYSRTSMESCQHAYMPTRRQLHAAGRQDLIESIMNAGGFLSVAQDLHLPARRRPNGFWDDLGNLDAELEWFINESWVRKADSATGRIVYVNEVTKMISLEKPRRRNVSDPSPVSDLIDDIGTAIMPRERTLKEAGRYDLHHAIALHGGYKAVAKALGRQSVPLVPPRKRSKKYRDLTLEALEEEIRRFIEKKGLSYFPSVGELKSEQRNDLIAALIRHGGLGVVADHVGIRPKRYGKRHWSNMEVAGAVLQAYLLQQLRGNQATQNHVSADDQTWTQAVKAGTLTIPTETQLMRDGRPDLRYLVRKYGQEELAIHLNLGVRKNRQRK